MTDDKYCRANPRVWCASPVVGSHFGWPCYQLHGSVRCASIIGDPSGLSGLSLHAFIPLRGLLPGSWSAPFKENADGARGIFRKCRARVGFGPAPGPPIKRPCTVLLRFVGWMMNAVDPDPRDTITCNTTCVVGNSRYSSGLSANYCLTQFTCLLLLLLEYMFFIYLFMFPVSFFDQHHKK